MHSKHCGHSGIPPRAIIIIVVPLALPDVKKHILEITVYAVSESVGVCQSIPLVHCSHHFLFLEFMIIFVFPELEQDQ